MAEEQLPHPQLRAGAPGKGRQAPAVQQLAPPQIHSPHPREDDSCATHNLVHLQPSHEILIPAALPLQCPVFLPNALCEHTMLRLR